MRMKHIATFTLLIWLGTVFAKAQTAGIDTLIPEHAQQLATVNSTRVFFEGNRNQPSPSADSVAMLINRFYLDQFRHSQDPKVPFFIFMSKDASMAMGVGGVVRMRAFFDWNGYLPGSDFKTYNIQIPKNPADMRRLGYTMSNTGLFFTLLGQNRLLGEYKAYVQGDFGGYNNVGFRLKKAYFSFRDWTVGYAKSTFCDPAAEPPVLDGQGPSGELSKTNVLVRWLHTSRRGLVYGGSLEFSTNHPDISPGSGTEMCTQYLPDAAALLQYQWDGGKSHVRLSGLLRGITYRDSIEQRNYTIVGWGLQASAVAKITRPITMYGIVTYGRGHSSYSSDLSIGNYDLVADPDRRGRLYAPPMLGVTWGATYFFRPNIYATVALGELRYLPTKRVDDSEYKYGLYGAVNCQWEITSRMACGIEYICGKRSNFNGDHANVNRINIMAQLSF